MALLLRTKPLARPGRNNLIQEVLKGQGGAVPLGGLPERPAHRGAGQEQESRYGKRRHEESHEHRHAEPFEGEPERGGILPEAPMMAFTSADMNMPRIPTPAATAVQEDVSSTPRAHRFIRRKPIPATSTSTDTGTTDVEMTPACRPPRMTRWKDRGSPPGGPN